MLEALTRRLEECPAEFLLAPRVGDTGEISVSAIAADHLRAMGTSGIVEFHEAAHLSLIAITCWVLHDDWFLSRPELAARMLVLLNNGLQTLAATVQAREFITDPDRREELVRWCLGQLGLRPQGESIAQAKDRMCALDSVERVRVLRDTRQAEARAQEVRRMMAKRTAEEAAAKATRE